MRLWFERGIKAKPRGYELIKQFSPSAFINSSSSNSTVMEKQQQDLKLLSKFYSKYPEVKYFPQANTMHTGATGQLMITHPAAKFIQKQRSLMAKGYTEQKAFEMTERDLGKFINQQKEEQRILRGVAFQTFGTSYLDRFQQVAEEESMLKVKRIERDIPKYLRSQEEWVKEANQAAGITTENPKEDENTSYERQSIEDLIMSESAYTRNKDPVKAYQPVLYEIVKDSAAAKQKEGLTAIQEGFIDRTERLLQIFHQRSHVHDGLKNLSDKEIILKVREGPTKLKAASKSLLVKLRNLGIKLNSEGEVDFSQVKEVNIVKALQKKETLVKVTLMQADLEFEYPQKLERMMIKADILRMVEEEEAKLKSIAVAKEQEELRKKVLTYEEYYNSRPSQDAPAVKDTMNFMGSSRKDTKYEDYIQEKASKYLFDNDLLEQSYKFWETEEDRLERLKKIWIDLKRKNALGGVEARTVDEQDQLSQQIIELARKVRFRIDQELTRHNVVPIFKENYRAYDKEEFLLDSDVEFFKIKKLLEKNPKVLKEDPILGIDYLKIINLIKRKKLVENTVDAYLPSESYESTFLDINKVQLDQQLQQEKEDEKLKREIMLETSAASNERLGLEDQETDASVRASKKKEERDKQKMLKQFDALSQQFDKSNKMIQNQKPTESAGDLKKKSKQKKEKTLAAKLRLKEKKTGSGNK